MHETLTGLGARVMGHGSALYTMQWDLLRNRRDTLVTLSGVMCRSGDRWMPV